MHEYDKCGKYMIQHHGDSILRLGDVDDVDEWKALQAEPVQARQLPDGLLEVRSASQPTPDMFIVEIATYPDASVPSQAVRDVALVYLQRGILPEVLVLFLHKKGNVVAADSVQLQSRRGFTKWILRWKAIKLWEVPAEKLLAMGDVGLVRGQRWPNLMVRPIRSSGAAALGSSMRPRRSGRLIRKTYWQLPSSFCRCVTIRMRRYSSTCVPFWEDATP